MLKTIALINLGLLLSISSVADEPDKEALSRISKECDKIATEAADKAGDDLLSLIMAHGGNISVNLTKEIEEAKPEFRYLYEATCKAEAIRKFGVKTRFPID